MDLGSTSKKNLNSALCATLCPVFFQGTLNLARRLGLSMPDVPHDVMVALLLDAWDCVVYKTGHTRKQMYRKVGCSHAKHLVYCIVLLPTEGTDRLILLPCHVKVHSTTAEILACSTCLDHPYIIAAHDRNISWSVAFTV